MARRRRYDTEALVGQLKAERRAGLLLSLVGIGILLVLVVLYVTGIGDDDEIPQVPIEESTAAKLATEAAKADTASAKAADSPTEAKPSEHTDTADAPPEEPTNNIPAQVSLSLSKKGVVWLDKKKLGKFKRKQIEIPAGVYMIRAKVGRKMVKSRIEIKSGDNLAVIIDHRKRKITVRRKK